MTLTRDIVRQRKEHLGELLNLTNMSSEEDVEFEELGESSLISLAELSEVVKKVLSGKAPGLDEIHPEIVRSLDIVGVSWLTLLLKAVWRSRQCLWTGRGWFPYLKKGSWRVHSNYQGVTMLSPHRKLMPGCWKEAQHECRTSDPEEHSRL